MDKSQLISVKLCPTASIPVMFELMTFHQYLWHTILRKMVVKIIDLFIYFLILFFKSIFFKSTKKCILSKPEFKIKTFSKTASTLSKAWARAFECVWFECSTIKVDRVIRVWKKKYLYFFISQKYLKQLKN